MATPTTTQSPRRKRPIVPVENEPGLDMSSMIDISFLLLVFFLVTSTLDPRESDLALTMPTKESTNSIPLDIDLLQINVDAHGQILLDTEVLDRDVSDRERPLLLDRLKTYAESARVMSSEPTVVISADDASSGQRFVDVLNALAHEKVAIRKVTIAGFRE